MSNRLAVLAAVLVSVLITAAPALAQDEVPDCELQDACLNTPEEQKAAAQYAESPEPAPPLPETPAPELGCEDDPNSCPPNQEVTQSGNLQSASVPEAAFSAPASCGNCGLEVAQGALDVIAGDEPDRSDSAPDAFGAALRAAREAEGPREAAASEETGTPTEESAVYQAAFEAAKEAGADDETAREAAEQAVAKAGSGKASKVRKNGEGETRKKGKAREDSSGDVETTKEDADEEVTVSERAGGSRSENAATTPPDLPPDSSAEGRSPLLLGGVAFLSVGGLAALRFVRSWSSSGLRRSPRN